VKEVLYVLLSAALVYYASLAAGRLLFHFLKLRFYAVEERFLAFMVGAGILSVPIFLLTAARLAYKGTFLALGLGLIAAAWRVVGRKRLPELPATPQPWKSIFGCFYAAFAFVYVVNALAPEASPDGSAYHLGLLGDYYRHHGFSTTRTSMFGHFPQGMEMLFFMAFPFAKHSGMVHALFLFALPFGMAAYGRRFGLPAMGVTGALVFFMIPVVGIDGASAYVDVGLAAVLFACFYLMEIWEAERTPALLVPIGLLAGYAYAVKYSGGPAIVWVSAYIAWRLRRTPRAIWHSVAMTALPALVMILPWVLKNVIIAGNPFSPLGNRWFPNPYIHISFEDFYRQMMATLGGAPGWRLPFEACVKGGQLHGIVGPMFLASGISIAALWNIHGRRLMAVAGLCSLPFLHVHEIRYLIPALPFLSLAFGLALTWRPWIAIAAISFHAVLSWPGVAGIYCDDHTWRLREIPLAVAFRRAPEGPYLLDRLGEAYHMAYTITQVLAPGETIFALDSFPRSYVEQNILVAWESAFGERMRETMDCAMFPGMQPARYYRYEFTERTTRRLRLVQKGRHDTQTWRINELRLHHGETELTRASHWRISATPNTWDADLALDKNPVTRWSTWQPFEPAMNYEIDFGESVTVNRIIVVGDREQSDIRVRVEIWDGSMWNDVGVDPRIEDIDADPGWRRAAIQVLRMNGLKWLLVAKSDWGADDLHTNAKLWGIRPKASTQLHTLFSLE